MSLQKLLFDDFYPNEEERQKGKEEVEALTKGWPPDEEIDEGKSWGDVIQEHINESHKKWSDSIADIVKGLKPCPFCGSTDVGFEWVFPPSVRCRKCWMSGPHFDTEKDAADAWNEMPRR